MRRSGALYRRRSPENCCPGTRYSRSTSRADDNQGTGLRPSCKGSRGPLSKCCCSSCPSTSAGVGVGCRCGAAVRGDRSGRGQSARGAAGQRAEIAAAQARTPTFLGRKTTPTSDDGTGTVCENGKPPEDGGVVQRRGDERGVGKLILVDRYILSSLYSFNALNHTVPRAMVEPPSTTPSFHQVRIFGK